MELMKFEISTGNSNWWFLLEQILTTIAGFTKKREFQSSVEYKFVKIF